MKCVSNKLAALLRLGLTSGRSTRIPAVVLFAALALAACSKRPEERAEEHYQKALQLIAKGEDFAAVPELGTAVRFQPNRLDVWRVKTDVHQRTGMTALYVQSLRRVLELDPGNEDAKSRLANVMIRSGSIDAAMRVVETVTVQDAQYHGTKALILAAQRDMAGAVQEAQKAVEKDPTNPDASLILASERAARNDLDAALRILNQAKVADANDTRVALAKIDLLVRAGKPAEAESDLRALIQKDSKNVALRVQLVRTLMGQRKPDDAEKELRAIAELNTSDSKAGLDVVRFIFSTKGADVARRELEGRVAKGGEIFPYQLALVDLEIGQRNLSEATRRLEALISDGKVAAADKNAARIKLAEVKISQRDVAAAEKLIGTVLEGDRRNVGALRLRAALRIDKGELEPAVADLREALNEQPKAPDLLLLMAQAYERNGQNELAERQYGDAVRAAELDPAVVLRYAAYLQRTENLPRAEEILTEALRKNPRSAELASTIAQVRLARKNWQGALQMADALARNEPTKLTAEQIRAAALAGQNKLEESLTALESAQRAAPANMGPLADLVRAYSAQKQFDKAEAILRKVAGEQPSNPMPLVLLGQLQVARGALADAEKNFVAAVALAPSDSSTHERLADFYFRQKKLDKALATVDAGLKSLPGNASLRLTRGGILDAKGDHDAAIAEFEQVLKEQPGSLAAANNLASLLLDYRTDKASLDRAQSMVDRLKGVKVPQFLDTLGWALHMRGDHNAALPLLEQAKAQLPSEPSVRFHLGMLYRAMGQETKALEELKAASLLVADESVLKRKIQSALN